VKVDSDESAGYVTENGDSLFEKKCFLEMKTLSYSLRVA
jgi:hypothetical protein